MADQAYHFRTALQGFNRQDVIHFLQELTQRHESELCRLRDENRRLREQLAAQPAPQPAAVPAEPVSPAPQSLAQQELEAYRRAESAERAARERAGQLLAQIDAILSGSPLQSTDAQLEQACGQLNQDLAAVQAAVSAVHTSLDGIRTQLQTLSHPE